MIGQEGIVAHPKTLSQNSHVVIERNHRKIYKGDSGQFLSWHLPHNSGGLAMTELTYVSCSHAVCVCVCVCVCVMQ
jgi:hypothetical protein